MKSFALSLVKLAIFWLFVFIVNRIVFFLVISHLLKDTSTDLIISSFYHAFRLDFSMLAYLLALPMLILLTFHLIPIRLLVSIYNGLNLVLVFLYNLTAYGEGCLYREWKAKLSVQALLHFTNPTEVFKTASAGLTILFTSLTLAGFYLFYKIYTKYVKPVGGDLPETAILKRLLAGLAALVSAAAAIVIMARGGLQRIPIQSSDSFFCNNTIANDAAVNPLWNLCFDFMSWQNFGKVNRFKTMDDGEAENLLKLIYKTEKADSTTQILQTGKPNIVFILLESWSANCVKAFGGDNYAPFLDSLAHEGIYFTNFYPAGYVSDQGIPAVLSSYPCTSRIAVINQTSKSVSLPCINQDLKKAGYQSGFLFGGDLNYGNIRSYVYNKEWDIVKEEKDFPAQYEHGALGIQDMDMSNEFIRMLDEARQPFVYTWFTVSSHMPYDFKGEKKQLTQKENDYVNSIVYSDQALRNFFNKASKEPWFNSTLFVICADHSHDSHKDFSAVMPQYHKIPMVLFGSVIKPEFRGKEMPGIYTQPDIVPSLLIQLGMKKESEQYTWGKNMFNSKGKQFSYFCSFGTGGFVSPAGIISFQHDNPELAFSTASNKHIADSLTRLAKAYQQMVYKDFMGR